MAGTTATALAIAGIAAGLAGTGTSIYEGMANRDAQSDAQKANQDALLQQQQSAANQANLTKQQAVLGAQGQAQAQTGGSLTDEGTASLTDLLAGYPGYQGGSAGSTGGSGTSTGTGIGASGVSGGAAAPGGGGTGATGAVGGTGSPDISAILQMLRGGASGGQFGVGGGSGSSITGGNWLGQSPAQPQSQFELSNPVV